MAKIVIYTIAYNESEYIQLFIKQWEGLVDRIIVSVSSLPWQGDPSEDDRTAELAKEAGAEVIVGYWKTEAEQRNYGLAYLRDYDYVITLDPDEFFTLEDRKLLIKECQTTEAKHILPKEMVTYWKTLDYIFDPKDKHEPTIAINPKLGRFREHRCPQPFIGDSPFLEPQKVLDITCHHLSWVKSDEKVQEKIEHFSHANDVIPNWYEDVWLKWTPENNMMIRPYGIEKSVSKYQPLPDELKELLRG